MQKSALKKLSILGLVLMGASAVTAAIIPGNKSEANLAAGSITASDDNVNGSCTPTNHITVACNDTASRGDEPVSGSTVGSISNNTTLGD